MSKKKILLVDDSNDLLDLYEIYLYETFEVTTATNGFEGLQQLEELMPDCVVTDIMMPVMDGIQFIGKMRKNEKYSQIPVVALTAYSSVLQEHSLEKVGFCAVISKPISQRVLISTIETIIGEK